MNETAPELSRNDRDAVTSGALPTHAVTSALPRQVRSGLTWRVLLCALVLIPANAWWLIEIEYIRYSDNATTQALFFNAISLLLILLPVNALLRRIRPHWAFTSQEMVTLYVVVAVASNLAGHDQLQILFTTITYVFRHDTPETGWGTKIIPYLPAHLMPHSREAVDALYTGNSTLYRPEHILPWLQPLAWWTVFVMLMVWTMLCLTALFRKQWDAERLSYPIAEIPVQIITQHDTLFRSRVLWIGFVIGMSGQLLNMIHSLFPSVPGVMIGVSSIQADTYPWNSAGSIPICTFPFAYGLSFLLPTQLGFSCWFFFLMSRVELVGAAMAGYTEWGKFPYVQQQGVGASMGLFLTIIWAARGHLREVWQTATGRKASSNPHAKAQSREEESRGQWRVGRDQKEHAAITPAELTTDHHELTADYDEPLSYRTALFGLLAGAGGMVWFAVAAGMRWQTAAGYLGILFVIVLVVARLRAELGLPTFEFYQIGADQVLQRVAGTSAYTRNDLVVMTLFFWTSRTHRQFPMQSQVDAVRLGKRTGTEQRSLSAVILAASFLGILCAFWAMLHSMYQVGYDSAKFSGTAVGSFGRDPWNKLDGWIASPQQQDGGSIGAYLFGALFTIFLAGMRARFLWWPFHPAGYLVAGSFGLFRLWLPIFVSWMAKTLILRYGGLQGYRRALPFFLGLVLGEFGMGFLRTILDVSLGLHLPPSSGIGGL